MVIIDTSLPEVSMYFKMNPKFIQYYQKSLIAYIFIRSYIYGYFVQFETGSRAFEYAPHV